MTILMRTKDIYETNTGHPRDKYGSSKRQIWVILKINTGQTKDITRQIRVIPQTNTGHTRDKYGSYKTQIRVIQETNTGHPRDK